MTKCIMKKNWTCSAAALELTLASCFIRQFMRLILHFYSELTSNHHRVFVITSFWDHMWNLVTFWAFWLTFLPACQHVFASAHLVHADRIRHQRVHIHYTHTEREWQANINKPIFFPGIAVLLLTVLQCFLTGEWHVMYCNSVVSGRLVCLCICVQGAWLWTAIAGRDVRFQCYQAKVSIFQDLLLHL